MQHAAQCKQPRLLLARCQPGRAANPDIYVFAILAPDDIRFGGALANGDHRNPMLLVNLHLFVEGDDHGMYVSAEHRVHYPTLEIASLYARDGPVIINSK